MPALSFSSCSRACTPAWDLARMRWRSTKPTRPAGGAWASTWGDIHHSPPRMARATAAAAPSILRRPVMLLVLLELERRAHGKVELAELVSRPRVWIDA